MITAFRVLAAAAMLAASAAPHSADARAKHRAVEIGGLAGPIIGGLAANNGYYAYGPHYWPGHSLGFSPLYGPAYPYAPGCYVQRQRIWTDYGWRWRQAPICY